MASTRRATVRGGVGFLDDTAGGDADLIRFLQQWSGYCLTGDTSLEELLFVFGPAGSGKSTFVAALAGVMGDYALNTPSETLMQRKHAAHREELARTPRGASGLVFRDRGWATLE